MRCFIETLVAILALTGTVSASVVLADPSFESGTDTLDEFPSPIPLNVWFGDPTSIVGSENGITPHTGQRMLRFDGTFPEFAIDGYTSGLWQVIDIAGLNLTSAVLSAHLNNVAATDNEYMLELAWAEGSLPRNPSLPSHQSVQSTVHTDLDPGTWERFSTGALSIPPASDFLRVRVIAIENLSNDRPPNEFAGNYADSIELSVTPRQSVIPEPSALAVWWLGMLGIVFARFWRRIP